MSDNADRILAALDRLDMRMGQLDARMGQLDTRMGQLDARMGQLDAQMDNLDARVGQLDARVGQLETRVGQLEVRVGQLDTGQTRLRTDPMDRMDRLQSALDQVKSDITVKFANTERVDRRAQSAQDEIRLVVEMVTEVTRGMRRLETRVSTLEARPNGAP